MDEAKVLARAIKFSEIVKAIGNFQRLGSPVVYLYTRSFCSGRLYVSSRFTGQLQHHLKWLPM